MFPFIPVIVFALTSAFRMASSVAWTVASNRLVMASMFLSMVFWGWTWGAVGMFLSVPLTMSVKIFLENTKDLGWIAALMTSAPSRDSAREGGAAHGDSAS